MDFFFDHIRDGKIKIRIMFTQNTHKPQNLTQNHQDEKFFILYYEFIKHAFGLRYSPPQPGGVRIRVYPDKLPDTREQVEKFRSFVASLSQNQIFRDLGLTFNTEDITDVNSHDHDALQCLDIILGAMQFRLNDKHKDKPPGQKRRGKRTIAKEAVYKKINQRIREIYPNFNIGISTGVNGQIANRWNHPYRHWRFIPAQVEILKGSKKKREPRGR